MTDQLISLRFKGISATVGVAPGTRHEGVAFARHDDRVIIAIATPDQTLSVVLRGHDIDRAAQHFADCVIAATRAESLAGEARQ